jgi:hypothetical protein
MAYKTFLTIGVSLSTLLFVYIGLTYMLTGYGFRFDVGWYLTSLAPHSWAAMGVAMSVGMSVTGEL